MDAATSTSESSSKSSFKLPSIGRHYYRPSIVSKSQISLLTKKPANSRNIKTFLCLPSNETSTSSDAILIPESNETVTLAKTATATPTKRTFSFDSVFTTEVDAKVFNEVCKPLLTKFLLGTSSCLLSLSHSTLADSNLLLTESLTFLMDHKKSQVLTKDERKFTFSAFGIQSETIKDLLKQDESVLELRKTPLTDALDIDGHTEKRFTSLENLAAELQLIQNIVEKNYIIRIKQSKHIDGLLQNCSTFLIVNLFIPETVAFPLSKISTETLYVHALWNCVKALSKKSKGLFNVHVPYRLSVVTRILQGALGGKCYTNAVLHINKALTSYENVAGTLEIMEMLREVVKFPGKSSGKSMYLVNAPLHLAKDNLDVQAEQKATELRKSTEKLRTELLHKYRIMCQCAEGQLENILQEIKNIKGTIKLNTRKIGQIEEPHSFSKSFQEKNYEQIDKAEQEVQKNHYIHCLRNLLSKLVKEKRAELTEHEKCAYELLCGPKKELEESEFLPGWLQLMNGLRKDSEPLYSAYGSNGKLKPKRRGVSTNQRKERFSLSFEQPKKYVVLSKARIKNLSKI